MTNNADRAIGRIEGMLKMVLENQARAEISRKQLYQSFEALRIEVADARRRIEALERRADAFDKPVAELKKWRERALGALMLLSLIGALIGGGVVAFWQKMSSLIR